LTPETYKNTSFAVGGVDVPFFYSVRHSSAVKLVSRYSNDSAVNGKVNLGVPVYLQYWGW
jgi:hypothetical protein